MRWLSKLPSALLLALATPAAAQETPTGWPAILKRVWEASSNIRYMGVRDLMFRRDGRERRTVERVYVDGTRSRIEFLPGSTDAGDIIVENGSERRHLFVRDNAIRIMPLRFDDRRERLRRIVGPGTRRGRFTEGPGTTVAGRRTRLVTVSSSEGGVRQKLWIDAERPLVLRREIFDPDGKTVATMAFRRVAFPVRLDAKLFTLRRPGAREIRPLDELRQLTVGSEFRLEYLPLASGASLQVTRIIRPEGKRALLQVYATGEGRVTLIQTREPLDAARFRKSGRDVRSLVWSEGERTYALLGEVPEGTLVRLKRYLTQTDR